MLDTKRNECDGSCKAHRGTLKRVRVITSTGYNWGQFTYCDAAIEEDVNNRGMTVEIVSQAETE